MVGKVVALLAYVSHVSAIGHGGAENTGVENAGAIRYQ